MGSLGVGHDWATSLSLFTFMHWRRQWQPTPVFLPGESQGQEPGGLRSVGSHRVGYDWSNLAAAATAKRVVREDAESMPSCLEGLPGVSGGSQQTGRAPGRAPGDQGLLFLFLTLFLPFFSLSLFIFHFFFFLPFFPLLFPHIPGLVGSRFTGQRSGLSPWG